MSICVYFRILLAICNQSNPAEKFLPPEEKFYAASAGLSTNVFLPPLNCLFEASSANESKSAMAPRWAYPALYMTLSYLCHPWDVEDVYLPPEEPIEDLADTEVASVHENTSSENKQGSEDSRSQRSLDINLDYMAYVKRTESLSSPAKQRLESENSLVG